MLHFWYIFYICFNVFGPVGHPLAAMPNRRFQIFGVTLVQSQIQLPKSFGAEKNCLGAKKNQVGAKKIKFGAKTWKTGGTFLVLKRDVLVQKQISAVCLRPLSRICASFAHIWHHNLWKSINKNETVSSFPIMCHWDRNAFGSLFFLYCMLWAARAQVSIACCLTSSHNPWKYLHKYLRTVI